METLQIGQTKITWLNGGVTHFDGGAMFESDSISGCILAKCVQSIRLLRRADFDQHRFSKAH